MMRTCSVKNCARPVVARGLCGAHYQRAKKGLRLDEPLQRRGKLTPEWFWGLYSPEPMSGCWLWTRGTSADGYGRLVVDNGALEVAHRVAWRLSFGEIPDGLLVCHKCDNPPCGNPSHLFLGTVLDNTRDMDAKGRRRVLRGESAGNSVLNEETVRTMHRLCAAGLGYAEIGRRLSVPRANVRQVVLRQRWAHVVVDTLGAAVDGLAEAGPQRSLAMGGSR